LPKKEVLKKGKNKLKLVIFVAAAFVVVGGSFILYFSSQTANNGSSKPIILYVNQGNGIVNGTDFGKMIRFSSARSFNTVFFQVYREGRLLFAPMVLDSFVNQTHQAGLKIYFALYITNASQRLPTQIFGLGEDGISLDMPTQTVSISAQQSLLANLKSSFHGKTAVTTADMTSPLNPDLLVLETYSQETQQFIKSGIVASVGIFATVSYDDYHSQYQYALQNSDGVMVFDYHGLSSAGY